MGPENAASLTPFAMTIELSGANETAPLPIFSISGNSLWLKLSFLIRAHPR